MKKTLLLLSLAAVCLAGLPEISEAKKKYRYIKRAHGIKLLHGGYDIMFGGQDGAGPAGQLNLSGAYAWNWKGLIETGPYFSLGVAVPPGFQISGWSAGLGVEYNFIKNRGKRKLIPAFGIKLGARSGGSGGADGNVEPVLTIKSFVSKRTAFLTSLSYALGIPGFTNFQGMYHNVSVKLGFAHYFDF